MDRILKLTFAIAGAVTLAAPALAADPAAGASVFKAECAVCHAHSAGAAPGVGPNLFGVVGRAAGTEPAYRKQYSPAMKSAGRAWTPAALKLYLASPGKVITGNRMPYVGLHDPAKLDNLVTYLTTLR
jgi:cytochrome c